MSSWPASSGAPLTVSKVDQPSGWGRRTRTSGSSRHARATVRSRVSACLLGVPGQNGLTATTSASG